MKRIWIGIALLLGLLALGIWSGVALDDIHNDISRLLVSACEEAEQENWPRTLEYAQAARDKWEKHWRATASAVDHAPMEEIDSLFAALEVYARRKDALHYASCCARLASLTQAIGESQSFNWWNLL